MGYAAVLTQTQSQNLHLTPQVQQSLKILLASKLELRDAVEQEVSNNPLLECDEPVEASTEFPPKIVPTMYERIASTRKGTFLEEKEQREPCKAPEATLYDYLFEQLHERDLTAQQKKRVGYLIGNVDENGYLSMQCDEFSNVMGSYAGDFEQARLILQEFEPAGIGAQNLQECLLLQLDRLGKKDSFEAKLVSEHLSLIEQKKFATIAIAEGVPLKRVHEAMVALKKLTPFPGRIFPHQTAPYIVPDLNVKKVGAEYIVLINREDLPAIHINEFYQKTIESKALDKESRKYLQGKFRSASWFIRCIYQREHTLYNIATAIMRKQRAFLDSGIGRLQPLCMKEIAEELGIHESTVSRGAAHKYIETPHGIFELRFFFATGLQTEEGTVATSSVRERIKLIIKNEKMDNPVTDQQVVTLLKDANIKLARRTVTKYREAMNIAASSVRKQEYLMNIS